MRFGQQPGSFTARRCRLSYGVSMYGRWTEEDEQHRQAHGYPTKDVRAHDGTEHAGAFVGRWHSVCCVACMPNVVTGEAGDMPTVHGIRSRLHWAARVYVPKRSGKRKGRAQQPAGACRMLGALVSSPSPEPTTHLTVHKVHCPRALPLRTRPAAEGCFFQFVKRGQIVGLDQAVCQTITPHTK